MHCLRHGRGGVDLRPSFDINSKPWHAEESACVISVEWRTDLEVQDDGPDESQSQLVVAVDYLLGSDVHQFDVLVSQEVQGHLDILKHVESHTSLFARLKKYNKNINILFWELHRYMYNFNYFKYNCLLFCLW